MDNPLKPRHYDRHFWPTFHRCQHNQIRQWRQRLLDEILEVFSDRRRKQYKEGEEMMSELCRQIGQLKVELEWVKKSPRYFS